MSGIQQKEEIELSFDENNGINEEEEEDVDDNVNEEVIEFDDVYSVENMEENEPEECHNINGNMNEEDVVDDNINEEFFSHDYGVENIKDIEPEESHNRNDNNNEEDVDIDIDDDEDDVVIDDDDADVYDFNCDNDSPLHKNRDNCHVQRALRLGKSKKTIFKLIELFPMNVQHKNKDGEFTLHTACCFSYIQPENRDVVAMKLIELYPEAARHKNSEGHYPLHVACYQPILEDVVMKLIEIFPEAAFKSIKLGNALNVACFSYQSETVIRKLIQINPEAIYETDWEGSYIIHTAYRQTIAVVNLLIDGDPLGMQQGDRKNATILHRACGYGNADLVQGLMQRSDLEINVRNDDGWTPLHCVCVKYRDEMIIDMLLHHPDVDVNAASTFNDTPLHKACRIYDNTERSLYVLKKLLGHPCIFINHKNDDDSTPLDLVKSQLDNWKVNDGLEEALRDVMKMINILEEFPIKRRWQAYCYHVKNIMDC